MSQLRMSSSVLVATLTALVFSTSSILAANSHMSRIPAPALDETPKPEAAREVAILAGGCFWGLQGVFQHVKGVTSAVSGYAGGSAPSAQYETVSTGTTGHAESVRVTFDPRTISYAQILQIYFAVAHDGTELNRQGPDIGTQYRSAIFPVDAEQASEARRAYRRFGKGRRHGAGLNFGDLFAYALARVSGEPLLFKGDDFTKTDVGRVL